MHACYEAISIILTYMSPHNYLTITINPSMAESMDQKYGHLMEFRKHRKRQVWGLNGH